MRRIRPRVITERSLRSGKMPLTDTEATPDQFTDRLVKYIPSEVVGGYVIVSGFIEGLTTKNTTFMHLGPTAWLWIVMVTFCVLAFIYMLFAPKSKGEPLPWFQAFSAPVAFLTWSFALGGPFEKSLSDYNKAGAAFLLIIVSLIIPALDLAVDYFTRPKDTTETPNV